MRRKRDDRKLGQTTLSDIYKVKIVFYLWVKTPTTPHSVRSSLLGGFTVVVLNSFWDVDNYCAAVEERRIAFSLSVYLSVCLVTCSEVSAIWKYMSEIWSIPPLQIAAQNFSTIFYLTATLTVKYVGVLLYRLEISRTLANKRLTMGPWFLLALRKFWIHC